MVVFFLCLCNSTITIIYCIIINFVWSTNAVLCMVNSFVGFMSCTLCFSNNKGIEEMLPGFLHMIIHGNEVQTRGKIRIMFFLYKNKSNSKLWMNLDENKQETA